MKIVREAKDCSLWCTQCRVESLSVGLVPTMGALHEGHLSLIRQARKECDRVVVTIFVNPTQFGPSEDLASYPSTPQEDLDACEAEGVDLVLVGSASDMYPKDFQTWVIVEGLSQPLCGKSRPTHFRGVSTVVTQLLNITRPHRAYFGQKDYQQTLVIRRLVRDLHMDTEIKVCPTLREADGLAMSSRNAYLDPRARSVATRLYRALRAVEELVLRGELRVEELRQHLDEKLAPGEELRIDYAEVLRADTLEEFPKGLASREPGGILVALAAHVGGARLIDNLVIPSERAASE